MRHQHHRGRQRLPAGVHGRLQRALCQGALERRGPAPALAGHDDLDDAFAWQEERTVTQNLTLQYDKVLFILEPNEITRPLARKRVTVIDYPDGRLAIRHQGVDLPYRTFDKLRQVNQAAIVENKRLGPDLAYMPSSRRSSTCPARPKRRAGVARRATCSRSDRWHSGGALRNRRLHAPPSQETEFKPNP